VKRKIILGAISALGITSAVLGAWCSRPEGMDQDHRKRIEAQVAQHRAETDLEIQAVEDRVCADTEETILDLNREVADHVCDPDLVDALNNALRGR